MNAASGTPTGSLSGRGTDGSNAAMASYDERADGAAGEPRHALGRAGPGGCGTKARSAASGSGTSRLGDRAGPGE